jgi:hypothetical protein
MKQALTAIKSLVLRSPLHHSISSRKAFAKHSFLLLLAGTVLLFSSCQKDKWQKTVPFKAHFTATRKDLQAPEKGRPWIFRATGTGTASYMGKTAFEALITIDVFGPPPVLAIGTYTLTAEDGDKIFMYSKGDSGKLTNTITGGTGRFADARGTLTGRVINGPTSDDISLEGRISY